jgi:hypothetical protein
MFVYLPDLTKIGCENPPLVAREVFIQTKLVSFPFFFIFLVLFSTCLLISSLLLAKLEPNTHNFDYKKVTLMHDRMSGSYGGISF